MITNEISFTKVSNKLMDALEIYQGTPLKHQILMHLIRRTIGYHRDSVLTSAAAIALRIRRNKVKTRQALHELIDCDIVIADSKEGPCRTRRLSINMNTFQWRQNALPDDAEEYENNQTCSTEICSDAENPSVEPQCELSREGSFEISQMDTHLSNLGSIKKSLQGYFERSQIGYTPSSAYIDGKSGNSGSKENIKEKERNIYV